jgi:hypothetical protein
VQQARAGEDEAAASARLNWWLPEDAHQHGVGQQPKGPAATSELSEPPDMFEEGRKRLENEEQQGRFRE